MAKWLHICLFILSFTRWAFPYTIFPNPTSYVIRNDKHGPLSYAPDGHQGAYYQEHVVPQHLQQLPYTLDVTHAHEYNNYGSEHGGRPILQKVIVPVKEQYPNVDESEDEYYGNTARYAYPSGAHGLYRGGYVNDGIIGSHDGRVIYGVPRSGYLHSDGSDYGVDKHSSYGDKGGKGYKSHENYNKGEESEYGSKRHENYYDTGVGKKGVHYIAADQYGSHNAASRGNKNGNFAVDKSRNKGEKTTGYHNVYHKNEYKKDREFYDQDDDSGHFTKHEEDTSHHGAAEGGYEKSGERGSVYYQDIFGNKGFNKGGIQHDSKSGDGGKSGHNNYFNSHENFATDAGSSHGGHHGYKGYSH